MKSLVIVESPTKAKTIAKFLPRGYKVKASLGHVRDLPRKADEIPLKYKKQKWATLGVDVEHDYTPIYIVPTEKKKTIKELEKEMEGVDELILATDEDREGESISWHLIEVLKPKIPIKRMVFHEITKEAIEEALTKFRKVDKKIVEAQETRRVLDRLFGYTLSPLLWKKIAVGLSAGRVQSVAVKLIVNREKERRLFKKANYFGLVGEFEAEKSIRFSSELIRINEKKIAEGTDFNPDSGELNKKNEVILLNQEAAKDVCEQIEGEEFKVIDIQANEQKRSPYPPFITSSLQIEANRKLGFSSKQTMQVAQKLYEKGYITYMRTDSTNLSMQAINAIKRNIAVRYGKEYLYESVRIFKKKAKGAQEAHEAIRPAGSEMKTSSELGLEDYEARLYDLIWKRTMATQMADARVLMQNFTLSTKVGKNEYVFKSNGRKILFAGFLKAYVEGTDNPENALDDTEKILPELKLEQTVKNINLQAQPHETKPPARYTDATLVKKLEAEGIGRPSTYATIISTIIDRGYVYKKNNQLIPTFTAYSVVRLLEMYFNKLIDLQFTAEMEESLDRIETGEVDSLKYLKSFYEGKEGIAKQVEMNVEKIDAKDMCTIKFPDFPYDIRVGRWGAFVEIQDKNDKEKITRVTLDEKASAPADLDLASFEEIKKTKEASDKPLGIDPKTKEDIYVKVGKYGPYVQRGEFDKEKKGETKRVSIPASIVPSKLTIDVALKLLELPKVLGKDDNGNDVKVGLGRFGPYILIDGKFCSIPKANDFLSVDLKEALEIVRNKALKVNKKRVKS